MLIGTQRNAEVGPRISRCGVRPNLQELERADGFGLIVDSDSKHLDQLRNTGVFLLL
jgi:hypothetical protein